MPGLDDYFREEADGRYDHPLLRRLAEMGARADFEEARAEVVRPRAPLGHKPARLYLYFYAKSGAEMDRPHPEDWGRRAQHRPDPAEGQGELPRQRKGPLLARSPSRARRGRGPYSGTVTTIASWFTTS